MKYTVADVLEQIKSMFNKADRYVVVCEIVLNRPFDQSSVQYMADRMFISDYDKLCVKMFELDIGGWVVTNLSWGRDCLDWELLPLNKITITLAQEIT